MKRLMIFMLMGCGATQGDSPENAVEPQVVAPTVVRPADAALEEPPANKLDAAIERRLYPQKFSATSHLENDWNKFQENYLAVYLGDDDPVTSWTEGKSDVGLGERVMVEHTPLDDATKIRLEIRNGYQKTPRLFTRNARAKDITLKLLPSGVTSKHTLSDTEGWQSVVAEQPKGALTGYEIQFDSVYKGSHYEDLVVSDLQTYVTSFTPDNPGYETSKQKRLLGWVEGRRLAAKTFKEAAKGSIPVAATYAQNMAANTAADEDACYEGGGCPLPFQRAAQIWPAGKAIFTALDAAAAEKFAGWQQLRVSTSDDRMIPQADSFNFPGVWTIDSLMTEGDYAAITLPTTQQLAYFSTKNLKRVYVETDVVAASAVLKHTAPGCKRNDHSTHYFYTPTTDGPLQTLLIATCGRYEDREGYTNASYWQVLSYGDKGQLDHLFDSYSAYAFRWIERNSAPFLKEVARTSTAGANDTVFTAR